MHHPSSRLALLPTVALLVALTACSGGGPGGPGGGGPGRGGDDEDRFTTVPVEVANVQRADLRRTVLGTTTLVAASQVGVTSEIAGELQQLSVEEGDRVEEGQIIARIVNEDVQITIVEAEQAVRRAQSEVDALTPLFEQGYLARRTYDEAVFQLESAQTSLRRARQTGGAQTVRAPVAGVVVERLVEAGELVVPNQALVEVAEVDRLEAVIAVPERELVALREGQVAEVVIPALGARRAEATVTRLDPTVDPQTGTIRVRLRLADEATEGPLRLRPGMFTEVRVVTDVREQALAVPKRAVVYEAGDAWVFVVRDEVERPVEGSGDDDGSGDDAEQGDDGGDGPGDDDSEPRVDPFADLTPYAVERVRVELGYEDRDIVEVVDGVTDGDRVVIVGQSGLDDTSVIVIPSERDDEPT